MDGMLVFLGILLVGVTFVLMSQPDRRLQDTITAIVSGLAALLVLPYCLFRLGRSFLYFAHTDGVYLEYCLPEAESGEIPIRGRRSLEEIEWIILEPTNYQPREISYSPVGLAVYLIDRFVIRRVLDYWIMEIHFEDGGNVRMAMMTRQEELLEYLTQRFPDRIQDSRVGADAPL